MPAGLRPHLDFQGQPLSNAPEHLTSDHTRATVRRNATSALEPAAPARLPYYLVRNVSWRLPDTSDPLVVLTTLVPWACSTCSDVSDRQSQCGPFPSGALRR
jgi:hypothetical protein